MAVVYDSAVDVIIQIPPIPSHEHTEAIKLIRLWAVWNSLCHHRLYMLRVQSMVPLSWCMDVTLCFACGTVVKYGYICYIV